MVKYLELALSQEVYEYLEELDEMRCLCDVTLSVYPHRAGLKNMPGHSGIRTYDLWNTIPMLCQLSYAVRLVRVCNMSELCLVPSISVYSNNHDICCVGVMYSGE